MDKKQYTYHDSSNVEHSVMISKEDFNLHQMDETIHDQKFKTKPTTFFKDALKRFAKNKSSVAGAVILGCLLLLSVIIPFVNTNDIKDNHPSETFLAPKLFPTGTGFWDGTKKYENIPCDPSNSFTKEGDDTIYFYPSTQDFELNAIIKDTITAPIQNNKINSPAPLVKGGYINLVNDLEVFGDDEESIYNQKITLSSSSFKFDLNRVYNIVLDLGDEKIDQMTQGTYQISASYKLVDEPAELDPHIAILKDYSTDLGMVEVNDISKTIKTSLLEENLEDITEENIDEQKIESAIININLLPIKEDISHLLIKTITITDASANPNPSDVDLLKAISISDANETLLKKVGTIGYWNNTAGEKNLYHGTAYTCSFTYDTYEAKYGNITELKSKRDFEVYVENGWISAVPDLELASLLGDDEESINALFEAVKNEKTDKYCPINGIKKVEKITGAGVLEYNVTCYVAKYKSLGYDKMPIYLWGTDAYGKDILKRTFVGLRNSLGLGLMTFAICFSFGLLWGSICGYFGGNVDLILERFTDILSGVPRIVIMTLCTLNLQGKVADFWIFILAMCLTGWIGTAALTRTQFYRFRDREYTLASRTLGAKNFRLIFRHILPNAMGTIITSAVLMIPSVIFTEATISYLGLGFKSMESLGVILSNNQKYLETFPHLILWPSAIMALIMISFNLFGNGLRDAFNPSLKGSE